jgi:hypothetical protein
VAGTPSHRYGIAQKHGWAPGHQAYHARYDRYGPRMVATVVSPEAARATLHLVPR